MDSRMAGRVMTGVLFFGLVAAGCDAFGPDGDSTRVNLSFEVANASRTGISANLGVASSTQATLTLDSAQVVLAGIKLHRQADGVNDSNCGGEELPRCGSFVTGPALVTLPLTGGKITPFSSRPTVGVYDWLEFRIVPREISSTFFAQNPNWPTTASVRVVGKYDGQPFDLYFRAATEIQENFDPPITINDSTDFSGLGVTVTVDVASWFDSDHGLIDPRSLTSGSQQLAIVERNIAASFATRYTGGTGGGGSSDD